jgi:hypothetical protein
LGAVCGHHRRCPWLLRALRLPDAGSIIMVNAVSRYSRSKGTLGTSLGRAA